MLYQLSYEASVKAGHSYDLYHILIMMLLSMAGCAHFLALGLGSNLY